DLLPGEALDLWQEAAGRVDRAVDVEAIADAGEVVVPAVARSRVHHAGAGVEGHVIAQHAGGVAVDPGMPEAKALQLRALRFGQRLAQRLDGALPGPARRRGRAQGA